MNSSGQSQVFFHRRLIRNIRVPFDSERHPNPKLAKRLGAIHLIILSIKLSKFFHYLVSAESLIE